MFAEAEPAPKQTNMEPNLEPKWAPLGPGRWKIILTQCGMLAEAEPAPKQTNMEPNLEPKWAPLGPGKKFILTRCGMLAEAETPRNTPTWNPTWNLNGHPLELVGEKLS